MKIQCLILIFCSSIVLYACKKGPQSEAVKPVFVSFKSQNGSHEFKLPECEFGYSNLSCSWGFGQRTPPGESFSIDFETDLKPGQYFLSPAVDIPVEFRFSDSLENEYYFIKGQLILTEADSVQYIYTGEFNGVFYSDNSPDSIVVNEGKFHFHKLF